MPYATRLARLRALRERVDVEIARELKRQRRRQERAEVKVDVAAVRAWAREVGHHMGERGGVPADLVDAYLEAHGKERR